MQVGQFVTSAFVGGRRVEYIRFVRIWQSCHSRSYRLEIKHLQATNIDSRILILVGKLSYLLRESLATRLRYFRFRSFLSEIHHVEKISSLRRE